MGVVAIVRLPSAQLGYSASVVIEYASTTLAAAEAELERKMGDLL